MSDLLGFYPELVRRGVFKGVDLTAVAKRLWKLEAMRSTGYLPTIRWHAHASRQDGAWGVAHTRARVVHVRLTAGASIEEAVETLLHELVHCTCPPKEHHGELFCRRLIACAREAFGLDLSTADLLALPARGKVAYAIDGVIVAAMTTAGVGSKMRADLECRFESPPVETEEQIAARRAATAIARIAAREARARAKLSEWEKKVETAKRVAAKWRTKVRYYKRRQEAAKRPGGSQ